METIVLASTSPQRQAILKELHLPFIAISPRTEEKFDRNLSVKENAEHIALEKAKTVIHTCSIQPIQWLIAADTLVSLHNTLVGKPHSKDEARVLLQSYSGSAHTVFTSICCYAMSSQKFSTMTNVSTVFFKELTAEEIDWYISLGEWQGAAGGYRIQGMGSCLISHIEGSYSGIMGLPIYELYVILKNQGYCFNL